MRFALALLAAAAFAQTAAPPGIVRGDLLDIDSKPVGELGVRTASNQVYRFSYDAKTYFERQNQRCAFDKLQKGDRVEIVSDTAAGASLGYARTVHVLEREARLAPLARRSAAYRIKIDHVIPMGDLTFAGIVSRVEPDQMVLRMRQGGNKTIAFDFDTVFV